MSAENVTIAKKALEKVLSDVKEKLGSDTSVAKIAYINYAAKTKTLIEALDLLSEGFFGEIDTGPEEKVRG